MPTKSEDFDVLIVGAGISGDRRRLSPDQAMPRHAALSFSKPRKASAAPGSPTAIRASAPTATFTPSATASSRGPAPPIATAAEILSYMGEVIDENDLGPPHPLSAHGSPRRRWSSARQSLDDRRHPHRHRREPCASPRISCGCARAITGTRKATRPNGTGWQTSRAGSSTRRTGRRTSTTRARRSSSSARAPPRRR